MYEAGDGVPRNPSEALRYYELAAEQQYPPAMEKLSKLKPKESRKTPREGNPRKDGKHPIEAPDAPDARKTKDQDPEETGNDPKDDILTNNGPNNASNNETNNGPDYLSTLLASAEKYGDRKSFHRLGKLYQSGGTGIAPNLSESFSWFKKSADLGYAPAQLCLADILNFGRGVPVDKREAARLYRLAAEQDMGQAQFMLGKMYSSGDGVLPNREESFKWFKKAADNNDRDAQYIVGFKYFHGDGVPKDKSMALKYLCLAHYFGHKTADYAIRNLFRRGKERKE
jgi:TPR repeat protein